MDDCSLRLLSWNAAYRVKRQAEQLAYLLQRKPRIVALQEVTRKTARLWREGLSEAGFQQIVTTFDVVAEAGMLEGGRRYGQVVASCWPLTPLPPCEFEIPWPERVLSAIVHSPGGEIEFHTAHIPAGESHGWIKIETFEGIYKRLACVSRLPRILCGDFNSPKMERGDGTIITFGQRIGADGEVVNEGDGRWARGEQSVITGLARYDLPDVYRLLNGYQVQEWSWVRHVWGRRHGGRFDHVFASRSLNPMECRYLHSSREEGLSDHAPIEVCFAPESQ